MIYENWLHYGALGIKTTHCPPLKGDEKCDCLVIGGGIAGLHAALKLIESGKNVILLEKSICGSGSSGQSGGFLTPDSEKDYGQLVAQYGEKRAKVLYKIPYEGVQLILNTIKKYNFNCDLRKQDSLYISIKKSHDKIIKEEKESREDNGLPYSYYNKEALKKIHPGKGYLIGLRSPGSYGINSFAYCQELKNLLLEKGVRIFEDAEVLKMQGNTAKTHLGSVTAKNVLICIDKMKTEFNEELSKKVYHLQTYLAVSEPLSAEEMKLVFPKGELMCWDTRIIYAHYRPIMGNRIIIGGSTAWAYYSPSYIHSPKIIQKFIDELKDRFPEIKDVNFTHYWSGLIDASPDLEPLVDYDKNNKSIYYCLGCAGLNWAAYCGDYIARKIVSPEKTEDIAEFTKIDRKFFFPKYVQGFLGKRITFALSHLREYFKT